MIKEKETKRLRQEKQKKFQEELRLRRSGGAKKSKVCKINKGPHIFNIAVAMGIAGYYKHYTLKCACGKMIGYNEKYPSIFPLRQMQKVTVCKKHGYMNGANLTCWACEMGFKPFEDDYREPNQGNREGN